MMYNNLTKRLGEKFPKITFKIENDKNGFYILLINDNKIVLSWKDGLCKTEAFKTSMEEIVFKVVSNQLGKSTL